MTKWSALVMQRCFRGYLARTKLLPHFRYLRKMLDNVDVGQVFGLYLEWQRIHDETITQAFLKEKWVKASNRLRRLVMNAERLSKNAVRAGATAKGAAGSDRDNMVNPVFKEVCAGSVLIAAAIV